ncbi:MTH1187 family thiamine-binding protein [Nitratidesulfovibrio vulgaris]|uniref:Thiamine-binding protein domain-containing protein n=1 Tax=Nitratidesulfovibrio vulgaris (strain DP4) TaxID=391774 RepID=A0A0H3A9J9_NITV4|nr:MTH1187 family thiamine-binding protein [Nitratidesulfovibrio vulgaris]ABM28857.1 protein of unknown function DUF77 [Nitratidesulfovibrio vulgaris DP4]WCB47779.1 MTH1187 family thiamine-binding protein [Nitratidesulfovibrio vulgaris]GEB78970.1 hypothetical protein DDE01_03850 [Desulfovibrio desulfuricans]HBW16595.1 thiamine-binding protein [Desulfovibrio sp.]
MMSVIAEIAIFPMDKGGSVSEWVAKAVSVIRASGLPHSFGPMGTCVEGEWEAVMRVVDQCYRTLEKDSDRLYMTLKIDARRGGDGRLSQKMASVEDRLA